MEVVLPVAQSLETVHHRTVETIGGRDKNDGREEEVELSETRIRIPGNLWEFSTTKDVTLVSRWRCHGGHVGQRMFYCVDAEERTYSQVFGSWW